MGKFRIEFLLTTAVVPDEAGATPQSAMYGPHSPLLHYSFMSSALPH